MTGKVAIVTGASKGIGAAIARAFAATGAAVAVNYASNRGDADRVVGDIVKAGGKAVAIQADVAKRADVKRLFAETKERLGRPSILVNNAGVYSFAPLEAVTEEDFIASSTPMFWARSSLPGGRQGLRRRGRQRDQLQHHREHPILRRTRSSFGVQERVRHDHARTRRRVGRQGNPVNAIAPGMTATEGFASAGLSAESAKDLGFKLPMGRLGRPDDIARVALFLASDQSAWVTGERISVSGGQR